MVLGGLQALACVILSQGQPSVVAKYPPANPPRKPQDGDKSAIGSLAAGLLLSRANGPLVASQSGWIAAGPLLAAAALAGEVTNWVVSGHWLTT